MYEVIFKKEGENNDELTPYITNSIQLSTSYKINTIDEKRSICFLENEKIIIKKTKSNWVSEFPCCTN